MMAQNASLRKAGAVLTDCINGVTRSATEGGGVGMALLATFKGTVLIPPCERYRRTA